MRNKFSILLIAFLTILSGMLWADEDRVSDWYGYRRVNFTVDGCPAWIVEPKQSAPNNPWVWCMEFPEAFTERTGVRELLAKGFNYVHIEVGNQFGSPESLRHFDAFYRELVRRKLSVKGTLIGLSRGGLYAYNWAAKNPDKVICIYGDAPVCDFKSWPGGKGRSSGSSADWAALMKCYGFKTENEALKWPGNPIDSLKPLAEAKIPLLHVVGDADMTVPVVENTLIVEKRYSDLGGEITVIYKSGVGHHPHGLDDPKLIVDFIIKNTNKEIAE